jgi:ATP-dependent protease HslVU (ClpYQ) peptidase subunit
MFVKFLDSDKLFVWLVGFAGCGADEFCLFSRLIINN